MILTKAFFLILNFLISKIYAENLSPKLVKANETWNQAYYCTDLDSKDDCRSKKIEFSTTVEDYIISITEEEREFKLDRNLKNIIQRHQHTMKILANIKHRLDSEALKELADFSGAEIYKHIVTTEMFSPDELDLLKNYFQPNNFCELEASPYWYQSESCYQVED